MFSEGKVIQRIHDIITVSSGLTITAQRQIHNNGLLLSLLPVVYADGGVSTKVVNGNDVHVSG